MSFRITFDGSLTGRTDVPQIVPNSISLVEDSSALVSPTKWENMVGTLENFNVNSGIIPNAYKDGWSGADAVLKTNNGDTALWRVADLNIRSFFTPDYTGTLSFEIRWRYVSGGATSLIVYQPFTTGRGSSSWGGPGTNIYTVNSWSGGWRVDTFTANAPLVSPTSLRFDFAAFAFGFHEIEVDYIRITEASSSPVTITPSTTTNGVAPTGGTPTTATPSTVIEGSAGIAGPTSAIKVITNDGAQVASQVEVEPPAESAENTSVDTGNTKIITATTTSLSTIVTGLDATNKLAAAETSIEVTALTDATEN